MNSSRPHRLTSLRILRACALVAATLAASPAYAERPTKEAQSDAQVHFKRAKEMYQTGSYKDAIVELEEARKLDPEARDLVFNLGVVSEKLGRIDDALRYFRTYLEMPNVTPQERGRAESYIKRLEGAKHETPEPQATPKVNGDPQGGDGSGDASDPKPVARGRIDGWTIGAAGVAVVGFGVGTVLGIKALSDKPTTSFVIGRDGTYADLVDRTSQAHTESVVADVGFIVGGAATIAAGILYFARPRVTSQTPPSGEVHAGAVPLKSGGAFVISGSFQ